MTGTPYESWFTPGEKSRYLEVMEWRETSTKTPYYRMEVDCLRWLYQTDMTVEDIARELGCRSQSVWAAIKRLGLKRRVEGPVVGPTYMAHKWWLNRKSRDLAV